MMFMDKEKFEYYKNNTQIIIISGGLGTRLKHRTGESLPKPLLKINEKTLLDYCIEKFSNKGFSEFVFLLGFGSDKILEHLKKYSNLKIRYSIEEKQLGKGGALRLALENNAIDTTKPAIITYPDDLIFDAEFPENLIKSHIEGVSKGGKFTLAYVDKTRYKYGACHLDNGFVKKFEEKPFVFINTTIGVYMTEPEVFEIIKENTNLDRKTDFETNIIPVLVENNLVYTSRIPFDAWVPVNDEKDYRKAEKMLNRC